MKDQFKAAHKARITIGSPFADVASAQIAFALIHPLTLEVCASINKSGGLVLANGQTLQSTLTLNDATTPSIALASGSTNTGTITINGKTSGAFILTTADATAQNLTLKALAQTSGAGILQIPDLAGSTTTIVTLANTQTLTNKTLTAPIFGTTVILPFVNTAVAATGSTNSDAAALTTASQQHVSSDSAAKGVKLPVGVPGTRLEIINDSATACKIYPDAGGNVNGATTTSGSVTILASKGVVAHCTVALTWNVFDLPAKSA